MYESGQRLKAKMRHWAKAECHITGSFSYVLACFNFEATSASTGSVHKIEWDIFILNRWIGLISILTPPYLQYIDQNHGVGDLAVQFLLLGHVGQIDEGPSYDAGPAVEEQLEVKPLADARVELNAHHVVVEYVPCELAVESQEKGEGKQAGEVLCYYSAD